MEQALEPADELRLGDPDLGFARHLVHRGSEGGELVPQVLRDRLAELLDRPLVHLGEPLRPDSSSDACRVSSSSSRTMLAIRSSFAGSVIVSEGGVVLSGFDGHGLFHLDRRLGIAHRLR